MSTPAVSHARWCEIARSSYWESCGATFNPAATHPDLPAGEHEVVEYFTPEGLRFVFTGSGFTVPGHGFVPYQNVFHVDWPPPYADLDSDHKNYVLIQFFDRPSITLYVGNRSTSVGELIIMMGVFTGLRRGRRAARPPKQEGK